MKKDWYKSKAIWGGLCLTGATILKGVGDYLSGGATIQATALTVVQGLSVGLGLIGVRFALK